MYVDLLLDWKKTVSQYFLFIPSLKITIILYKIIFGFSRYIRGKFDGMSYMEFLSKIHTNWEFKIQ